MKIGDSHMAGDHGARGQLIDDVGVGARIRACADRRVHKLDAKAVAGGR
jgi:hypothetical protein